MLDRVDLATDYDIVLHLFLLEGDACSIELPELIFVELDVEAICMKRVGMKFCSK
jgi:hypothetical protein